MYACTELDTNDQCLAWTEVIYGLPPLTQSEVATLSVSIIGLWITAMVVKWIIRFVLNR